jgi:hypothetical protein
VRCKYDSQEVLAGLAVEQQEALALARGGVLQGLVRVLPQQLCACEGAGQEWRLALMVWLGFREHDEEA